MCVCVPARVTSMAALRYSVPQAWVGHPYVDIIDNSTHFDEKVQRVVDAICERFRVPFQNPRREGTRKHKFLIDSSKSLVRNISPPAALLLHMNLAVCLL